MFQSRPDLKGIKTEQSDLVGFSDLFQSRPDLKGIKTPDGDQFDAGLGCSKADPI